MLHALHLLFRAGFHGFITIDELRRTRLHTVPDAMGVYMILRTADEPPVFLNRSPAGHFNSRDPTVPLAHLRANWVEGTPIIYIGKAGAPGESATLKSRLDQYLKFGAGVRSPHKGGRLIWQIAGADSFLVCWKVTPEQDPRDVERALISQFRAEHAGRRPFANLQD